VPRTRPPLPSLPGAADLFRLLGEPTRLRLLLLLAARGEVSVNDLGEAVDRSQPVVSAHLILSRRCRVIVPRREGRRVYYRLNSTFVADVLRRVDGG
jgi:DNA-binding transcriptional ArsR family regulator